MIDTDKVCLKCFSTLNKPRGICPFCGCNNSTVSNESHQLECGSILAGIYLVGKVLGQGGFGITYVGWDLNLNMKVAIKEYYPEGCVTRDTHTHLSVLAYAGTKEKYFHRGKERFVEEARTLARFSGDSGVVGVRAFFYENGTAYIVMDFVEGETLKSYAAQSGGKLRSAEVLSLFRPLIKSIARVHESNLLHRDISPDNIMVRPNGALALLDFGAARQISAMGERSNTINVKHGYAPEEQYRTHGEQGPWTDVYALCATIYRLTTGVTPTDALDRAINEKELTPPNMRGADFTPKQESAIMHGLAVKASMRTQNMRALIEELYGATDTSTFVDLGLERGKWASIRSPRPAIRTNKKAAVNAQKATFWEKATSKKNLSLARKAWLYVGFMLLLIAVAVLYVSKYKGIKAAPNGSDFISESPYIIEAASELDTESVPTENSESMQNTPAPTEQPVSAVGLWSLYGLYENWDDETYLTTSIPDDQLTDLSSTNIIALFISSEYFQYYDSIGSWSQDGNQIFLNGDDLVNAGAFYMIDANTLHESIRGDIVVYKRMDTILLSEKKASVTGKWNAIGYYDPDVSHWVIDAYAPIPEQYLQYIQYSGDPLFITETMLFNSYYGISSQWEFNEDGRTIYVEGIDDYFLVLVDANTVHEFYGDGAFIVYRKAIPVE